MLPALDLAPGVAWSAGVVAKVTVLLMTAVVLALALRRASAAARHLVWSAAVVSVLAVPILASVIPWRLPVLTIAAAPAPASGLLGASAGEPAAPPPPQRHAPESAAPAAPAGPAAFTAPAVSAAQAVAAIWLAGALLLLLRLAVGAGVLARVASRAVPLTDLEWTRPLLEGADRMGLDRAPRLLMSDRLPMPYASGFFRPTIVLPESAAAWDDRRRRAVLCHELAHLRRLDLVLNGVAQLACALWWFHPLVWVAARKLRTESERACDDLVLGVGTRASEYADHLLHIVCGALRARTPAVALPMAQRREFEGRMLAILDRDARRGQPSARHAAVLAALAVTIVLPLAALGIGTAEALPGNEAVLDTAVTPEPASSDADIDPQAEQEDDGAPRPAPRAAAAEPGRVPQDTGMPRVIAALVRALDDPVAAVRKDAAYALGNREVPQAVTALAAKLTRDPDAEVREMAAWALGQIESRAATTALGAAARRDSSEAVRGTAVWALGQLEDPQSVTVLAEVLADPSAEVRGRAAWALGVIAARPAHAALVAALRDASAEVRMRAAWALGQIEDPAAVNALVAAFRDPDADVRKAAFWAAAQLPGEEAEPALLAALEHEDPEIRAMAARALGGGGLEPWPWPWPWPR
jgi:HEAT repeat protein